MKPIEQTDEELMGLYVQGSQEAFAELFDRYEKRIMGFLRRRLGHQRLDDLDDLFQLSWLKLHQSRDRYDVNRKFSSWFYGIIVNALRDYYKQARWKYEIQPSEELSASFDSGVEGEQKMIDRQIIQKMSDILETLSETQREILLLSDAEGFQSKEIGEMMDLTDANVRQLLYRARQTLRKAMAG